MTSSQNLLIVDDHLLVGEAMGLALGGRRDVDVLGVVRTCAEVHDVLAQHRVDLLLTEIRLTDDPEALLIGQVLERSPATKVLVVTSSSDDWSITRAVDGGCHGYLLKEQPLDELVGAIDALASGEAVFAAAVMSKVLRLLRPSSSGSDALTRRELEVLRSLAAGKTTEQIAAELYVSLNTARNHINSVIRKLGAHSRLEAVSAASRMGLIRLG